MIITPHVLSGALIASCLEYLRIRAPNLLGRKIMLLLAASTGFYSHFLLDSFPHYDYSIYSANKIENAMKILIDFLLSAFLLGVIFQKKISEVYEFLIFRMDRINYALLKKKLGDFSIILTVALSAFFAILPDITMAFCRSTGMFLGYIKFHDSYHSIVHMEMVGGVFLYFFIILFLLFINILMYKQLTEEDRLKKSIEEIDSEEAAFFGTNKKQ